MRDLIDIVENMLTGRVFHGSNNPDFDGVLVQRGPSKNPTHRGLNYIGSWFTSNPEMARFYAQMPGGQQGPIHVYHLPEDARFWPAGRHQWDFLISFTYLMSGHATPAEIQHLSRYRIEKAGDVKTTPGMEQEAEKYRKTEAICIQLVQDHEFMIKVKEALVNHGYSGIVWKDSRIDLGMGPNISGHDVYLVFPEVPMTSEQVI
jgi:hypothetical protein